MLNVINSSEGVRIIGLQTNDYKTNQIIISMALPLDDDTAANALTLYLLRRSCKKYPDFSLLNSKLDSLYGASLGCNVSKIGDAQVLSLSITYIDDRFALYGESISSECIELLSDIIFNPNVTRKSFGKENLDNEKRLMIERIEDEFDDKRTYAFNKCIEKLCYNDVFAKNKLGTTEEVKALRMPDIYAAWKRILSTAVFQITSVGSADSEEISNVFTEKFQNIERNVCQLKTSFLTKSHRSARSEEIQPVNQGKLVLGFRTGMHNEEDRKYEHIVMNDIFGGGTYSKLFTVIREKMSLAYYCWSRLIVSKGLLMVEAGIDTDKEKQTTAGIINQLNEVRSGNISPETLDNSKKSLKENYTFSSPSSFAAWYDSQICSNRVIEPDEAIKEVEKVTVESIKECAKQLALGSVFMLSSDENAEDAV
ncbi:MAG: insulinase family protein [Clostridiales bacterium]|nr:insulinase family protein [Clostridiales bacterium]